MCGPALIPAGMTLAQAVMVGSTVIATAASAYGQHQSASANAKALSQQNQVQAEEIAKAAGNELHERARAARRERAEIRASAAESGINLGSNSFLAALQASAMNQYNDEGLIVQNERGQQRARAARARSLTPSVPNALALALTIGAQGYGAYSGAKSAETAGSSAAYRGAV